jgi:hypothetical protein
MDHVDCRLSLVFPDSSKKQRRMLRIVMRCGEEGSTVRRSQVSRRSRCPTDPAALQRSCLPGSTVHSFASPAEALILCGAIFAAV